MFTTATKTARPAGVEQDQVLKEQQQAQKLPEKLPRRTQSPWWPTPSPGNGLAEDGWDAYDDFGHQV